MIEGIKLIKSHLLRWLFLVLRKSSKTSNFLGDLKFEIGEQYEKYEFDLEEKGCRANAGITYDLYKYIKNDFSSLFELEITRGVFLLFNADILSAVFYRFQGNQFYKILDTINRKLPINNQMMINPFINDQRAIWRYLNIVIELRVKKDGNTGLALMSKDFSNHLYLGQT